MAVSIHQLLKYMVDNGGSDLHITVNSPPQVRFHGKLSPIPNTEALAAAPARNPNADSRRLRTCRPVRGRAVRWERRARQTERSGSRRRLADAGD